ncbi:hypothetical protein H4J38_13700 [Colwellia sp. BRX10-3]|uniref:hypothetical protein n=1 Tax=Colwellia sp. BRX10-3 TaxID=2759844 RepID=UPI0015F3A905|nr:hypothetical protein [Colwellia sp. BRX10-3]MBA6391823.1 hypothetical protein [Colwellia sp. BRX10-3]
MNKSINWAAIIMLSITANSAMATTLSGHVDTHQEKAKQLSTHASSQAQSSTQLTKQQKATPLARVLAQSENKLSSNSFNEDRTLNLEISELKDNSGLVYLGGKVSLAELSRYLEQLKTELGEEQYAIYRQHQAARDHQSFHVTLINPYEYQTINKDKLKLATQFRVILHGLGRVENDEKKSYFVVASSPDGQFIRQNFLLNNKDFHVTLGFFPEDIYGVSKGRDTLINK